VKLILETILSAPRLLERAAKLSDKLGAGFVDSTSQSLKRKLVTYPLHSNKVISSTDGQIFLETDLFYAGVRPPLTRRLGKRWVAAPSKAMKTVAGKCVST